MSSSLSQLDSNVGANNGLVLELTHDSPSHSNLTPVGEDKPIYRVTTDYPEGRHPLTVVVDASDKCAKPQKISTWMNCGIFKGEKVTFKDEQGRKYYWRGYTPWGDNPAASLTLHADDRPEDPIVEYVRPPGMTKTSEIRPWEQRPKLILQHRALQIQDLAVVSWLFLEKARRVKAHVPLWF